MRDETLEAPDAVARCLAQDFSAIGARLRALDPAFVVVCGRGSSSHAGTFLRVLLGTRLGLVAAAAMPSIASVYDRPLRLRGALFIAISQSGGSPDLLAAAHQARAGGALTLAIVNAADSPLAKACDLVLDIQAGPERSVAATKSVLATLAACLGLVQAWAGGGLVQAWAGGPGLTALPRRLAEAASLNWSPLTDILARTDRLFTIGRGPGLGIAKEAALKLAETCGIAAIAHSAAELAHGPMVLAGPDFPVVAFLQNDAARPHTQAILAHLIGRGVPVLAAGGDVPGAIALPVLPPTDPTLDLPPMLLSFYLAAEAAARRRGHDPDAPPDLHKITRTT